MKISIRWKWPIYDPLRVNYLWRKLSLRVRTIVCGWCVSLNRKWPSSLKTALRPSHAKPSRRRGKSMRAAASPRARFFVYTGRPAAPHRSRGIDPGERGIQVPLARGPRGIRRSRVLKARGTAMHREDWHFRERKAPRASLSNHFLPIFHWSQDAIRISRIPDEGISIKSIAYSTATVATKVQIDRNMLFLQRAFESIEFRWIRILYF